MLPMLLQLLPSALSRRRLNYTPVVFYIILLYYDNESHDHAVCMPYIPPGTRTAMAGDVRYKK